jgi:PAS domain S-box-containing protein
MSFIERASIKRKQMLIIMLITSVALLLACAAFGAYEVITFRKAMLRNLTTLAQIVGGNCAVALDFDDQKAAEETLASLKVEPNIVGACVFDKSGRIFAQFDRTQAAGAAKPPPFQPEGYAFSRFDLKLYHLINYKGDMVGMVYIASDMEALYRRLERYGAIAGGVFGVTMLIALGLSARLQRLVSDPILRLVQTTRLVARDKDYSIRVARHSQDEIGELIDGFNEMLAEVQQRDAVLQRAHGELEQRVRDRTQELAGSLSLVHATLESTADGILVADGAGKAINWNKKFMLMWRIPQEVLEAGDEKRLTEQAAAQLKDPVQFTAKIEELYGHMDMESFDVLEFKDGRIFERYSQPQRIEEKCVGRVWSFRDITERRRVEAELDYERELLRSLLNSSPDHIYFKDLQSRFITCSRKQALRFGAKNVEEIIGKTDYDFHREDHARKASMEEQEIMRTGQPMLDKVEKLVRKGEEQTSWALISKLPLRNKAGEIIGTFGISKDITAIKQVEAELAAERDLLGMLMENSPDMIYFKDRQSRFLRASKAFADRLGGRSPESIVGRTDFEIYSEEHARPAFEDEQEIIRTGKPLIGKIEKETWQDDRVTWVLTSKMPLRDKDGEIAGTFGISKDITAIKQVEAELAAERDLLGTLLENSPDMIYFKDRDSRFLRSSKTHVMRMGRTRYEEVTGKTDFDFFSDEHARPAYEDEQAIVRTGKPLIGKIEKETFENGEISWVLTSKMPLRDKHGGIIGTFGISKDISAIKEAEARLEEVHRQLLETSRMAGMAEVATSVLHNVGNVLNSVNVSCSVVTDRVHKSKVSNLSRAVALIDEHERDLAGFFSGDPKGKQLPAYLKGVAEHLTTEQGEILQELAHLSHNIDHIKEIVAMQQSYSKVSGVRELLPAQELVEDALRMNGAAFDRHQVKVIREYAAVPPVMAEKHKVLQILINLLRNAKYACDDTGRVDKQVTLRIEPAGKRVKISVMDNGVGIPPENLTRIFEHGFTTRKEGHGFGLHSGALAAKDLGGALSVTSEGPGRGACFSLELPCQPTEQPI